MAAGGADAAAAAQALLTYQLKIEKHFATRVEALKEDEHGDFPRWHGAIMHPVRLIEGAAAALEDAATVTPVAAVAAMGAPYRPEAAARAEVNTKA